MEEFFFQYLQSHKKLVKFITAVTKGEEIGKSPNLSFEDYRQKIHQENVEKLQKFETKLKRVNNKAYVQCMSKPAYIPPSFNFTYHKIRFLEDFINNYHNNIDKFVKRYVTEALPLFTVENMIPTLYLLVIDQKNLTKYVEKKKKKIKRLKDYHETLVDNLKKKLNVKFTLDNTIAALNQILNTIHPSFDSSLAFFCPNPIQDSFEVLLFHPDIFCAEQVNKILTHFSKMSPTDFVFAIVKFVEFVGKTIDKTDSFSLSALIGLCFRAFFDRVYPEVKLFMVPELSFDLIATLHDFTVAEIEPPRACCPPLKDTDKIRDIFKNDAHFSLAVEQAEFISFFTNPLDILHHMYHALCEIEKAAHVYGGNDSALMSFDVTFGLVLCVLLSADIPELMRIAMFTDQFTPETGLCPDFEFARAKLSTASVHLQNKAQQKMSQMKQ